jgi:hypothetical protein
LDAKPESRGYPSIATLLTAANQAKRRIFTSNPLALALRLINSLQIPYRPLIGSDAN